MKLIHAIFLGQQSKELAGRKIKEAPWLMGTAMAILAALCVGFGLFAKGFVLKPFIEPVVKNISYIGFWEPVLATILILIGLFAGGIIYFLGRPQSIRESEIFTGGEILEKGHEVSGVDFYRTVQEMGIFKFIYQKAEKKLFDIYEVGKKLVFSLSQVFQDLHTGVLPTYLIWSLAGLVILIIIFCKGGL
jgi:NADH:ubiquinone oxidoreductase subunit 5 (subunit L)/multisubunit Na+/H+ antiporter MnhA subunit